MEETIPISPGMASLQNRHIAEIIATYSRRLKGFISKRVKNEADAEDILQDVFYQLTEAVRLMRPIEQLTSWLFTVTRNKITDAYRKKKPEALDDLLPGTDDGETAFDLADFAADPSDSPEMAYLRSLFRTELQEALDELPPAQREVFILHELEAVPFREIADMTGESVNTLISRKRYAVLYLRERLQVLKDELLNF